MIETTGHQDQPSTPRTSPQRSLRVGWWFVGLLTLLVAVAMGTALGLCLLTDAAFANGKIFDDSSQKSRLAELRREKKLVESMDGPDHEFHAHLMTAAAERVDYAALRGLPLWRALRLSFILRLIGLLAVVTAAFAILGKRERARWWLLAACLFQIGLTAYEAGAIHRELPRFSEAFVRDWHLAYEEVQREVPYRATLAVRGGIDEESAIAGAWIWFLAASIFWQILALLCARGLTRSLRKKKVKASASKVRAAGGETS